MQLPWFRLYTEFASDPKVQILAFEDQRHFIMLLCLKGNGILDSNTPSGGYRDRLIAKSLGLDPTSAAEAKRRLVEGGLIGSDWQPISWDARQFKSDYSTLRVRKFRDKQTRNADETFPKRRETVIDTDTDTDTDTEKNTTAAARPTYPTEFVEIRYLYPPRAGSNPWPRAFKACLARLKEGSTWSELADGVRRYQSFCAATGKINTEFVMQAATFFGRDKRFAESWALPASKAETLRDSNITATVRWLEEKRNAVN